MPVIPTYDAKVGLDPDQAPHVNYDKSQFEAQARIGGALEDVGSSVSSLGAHLQQRQDEKDAFNAQIGLHALQQNATRADMEASQSIAADGSGWADSRLAATRAASNEFLTTITNPKLREEYGARLAMWQDTQHTEYAKQQLAQQNGYYTQNIQTLGTNAANAVLNDPSQLDAQIEQQRELIAKAGSIPILDRQKMLQEQEQRLQMAYVYGLSRKDPSAAQAALGVTPRPGSVGATIPSSTFQRMIGVESGGNPSAVSNKGAIGVAQVMPDTAREVAKGMGLTDVAGMSDAALKTYFTAHPDVNAKIGATYFNQMLQRYRGDQEAAVVAYNAGPERADAWLKRGKDDDVLPHETIVYKAKVLGASSNLQPGADTEGPEAAPTPAAVRTSLNTPNPASGPGSGLLPYLAKGKDVSSVTNLNSIFSTRLQQALADAPPEIQNATTLASGFRTNDHQAELYQAAVQKYGSEEAARKWVAPPGHSNHNAGQAADLSFKTDAAKQWWHDNADKYGLKFPLANEAWHVEPKETRGGGGTQVASVGYPVPDTTAPDPRLASIPFEKRLALSNDIARNEKAAAIQASTQQKADHDSFMNQMQIGIHDGKVGQADIETARSSGKLTDYDDINKLETQIQRRDKQTGDLGKFDQALVSPTFVWNPLDKDHRDMVDAGYAQLSKIEGAPSAARHVVEKTGILPSDAGVALRGAVALGGDHATQALQTGDALLRENDHIFVGMSGGDDFANKVVTFRHYVNDLGLNAGAATQKIVQADQPEYQQKIKSAVKGLDFDKVVKDNLSTSDLGSAFNQGWTPLGRPDVGATPSVQREAMGDYEELFRMNLENTADVGTAKALAVAQMKKVWGTTSVTGSPVLTRYPVDKAPAYAGISDVSDRIAAAATDQIKAETGADVDRASLALMPTVQTPAAFKAGSPPPMTVSWADKDGLRHIARAPLVLEPDSLRAMESNARFKDFMAAKDRIGRLNADPGLGYYAPVPSATNPNPSVMPQQQPDMRFNQSGVLGTD